MPSENKTPNYGLNQWQGNEYPKRQDFVDDNAAVDAQMKKNEDAAAAKIPKSLATASDQILVSSGVGAWIVKTLAQFKAWLGLGSAAYKNVSDFETPSGAQAKVDALAGAGNTTTVKALKDEVTAHKSDNSLHAISTNLVEGTDLNTVTRSGFYRLSATNPNMPAGCAYGQLLVVHGAMDTILQIASGYNGESPYYRNGNPPDAGGAGSWSAWKRLLNQSDYDTLFQYANDGKTGIANAVTAKGVAASPTDTFATLATKIGQIPQFRKATGQLIHNNGTSNNVTVSGLAFRPKYVFLHNSRVNLILSDSPELNGCNFIAVADTAIRFDSVNESYYGAYGFKYAIDFDTDDYAEFKWEPISTNAITNDGFSVFAGYESDSFSAFNPLYWIAIG